MRINAASSSHLQRCCWLIGLLFCSVLPSRGEEQATIGIEHAAAIDAGARLFVPAGYKAVKTPSLAFAQPLREQGAVPGTWPLVPEFFLEHGQAGASLTGPAGASLYGTGEVTGPLLRNDQTIRLWNTDNYAYHKDGGHRLYQSHPWVLRVRTDGFAFGVIFDTTWKSELQTGSDKIILRSEGAPFRVVAINLPTPQAAVRELAELTGKMPMPPLWALGFHQCRYSYYSDVKVREIADGFRARKIPCDVIWMDIDYLRGFRVFTFDPARFPDPKSTNDYLHAHAFQSVWMIDPGVKVDSGYSVSQFDAGGRAQGDLYEDAGEGLGYSRGEYALTHYSAVRESDTVTIKAAGRQGNQKIDNRLVQVSLLTADGVMNGSGEEAASIRVNLKSPAPAPTK